MRTFSVEAYLGVPMLICFLDKRRDKKPLISS